MIGATFSARLNRKAFAGLFRTPLIGFVRSVGLTLAMLFAALIGSGFTGLELVAASKAGRALRAMAMDSEALSNF